jgi:hypothetical protein
MSKLIIVDLEDSIELDREAMRAIIGLGTRRLWPVHSTAFFLLHPPKSATGLRAAASRWSAFLRPLPIEPLQPQPARRVQRGQK